LMSILRRYCKEAAAVHENPTSASSSESTATRSSASTSEMLLSKPKMARLVERFVTGLTDRISAMESAIAEEDRQRLRTLAHQLKGAAGGYGLPTISQAAAKLENAAEHEAGQLDAHLKELIELCDSARREKTTMASASQSIEVPV
jgi:HPt (histidine-containing phosphotransfer) domain-containing protein